MAKVGSIVIDLVANTGKLLAPLKKAESAVSSLVGKFARFGGIGAAIAAPIAGLLTLNKAVNEVKQAFADLDNAGKESDRLGIPTEKLTALQHAADLAGVSAEQLGIALQFMMRKGFSVSDLGRLADEMVAIEDPVKRMQWTIERFGRSGAGMINVLGAGSAGLKDMEEDARKLGLTVSRWDAAQVEAANDAFARIGKAVDGIARVIAIKLAPYITWLSDSLVSIAVDGETTFGERIGGAVDYAIDKIGMLADAIWSLKNQWEYAKLGAAEFAASLEAAIRQADVNIRELANFITFHVEALKDLGYSLVGMTPLVRQAALGGKPRYAGQEVLGSSYDVFGATQAQKDLDAFLNEAERLLRGIGKDVEAAVGGTPPSERMKQMLEFARNGGAMAGVKGLPIAGTEALTGNREMAAALERGSQEAFQAINATIVGQKAVEQKQLDQLTTIAGVVKNWKSGSLLFAEL